MHYSDNVQFRDYGIILARIDDRLVHGQVVAGWNRILKAKYIVVVSDEVADDDFRRTMIESAAAPGDIVVKVLGVKDAVSVVGEGSFKDGSAILLFAGPSQVVDFIDANGLLSVVNVGGLHQAPGKREYATALWLDAEDIEDLYGIRETGVELFYQMVPMENARDIFAIIESKDAAG